MALIQALIFLRAVIILLCRLPQSFPQTLMALLLKFRIIWSIIGHQRYMNDISGSYCFNNNNIRLGNIRKYTTARLLSHNNNNLLIIKCNSLLSHDNINLLFIECNNLLSHDNNNLLFIECNNLLSHDNSNLLFIECNTLLFNSNNLLYRIPNNNNLVFNRNSLIFINRNNLLCRQPDNNNLFLIISICIWKRQHLRTFKWSS